MGARKPAEEEGGNLVEEDNGPSVEDSRSALEGGQIPIEKDGQTTGASPLETFQGREPVSGGARNPLHELTLSQGGEESLFSYEKIRERNSLS